MSAIASLTDKVQSIANTVLTAKKDETIDLSNLYVSMKISVLEHAMAERIIPKISEYSNSQNKYFIN